MPSAVIEVVLGLVFVFFIFSMLCSGINELISRAFGKRADFLAAGLWNLLDNSSAGEGETAGDDGKAYFERFLKHPLVRQLGPAVSEVRAGRIRKAWDAFCRRAKNWLTGRPLREVMGQMPIDPREYENGRLRPSYIPPAIFATVVTDFLRTPNNLPDMPSRSAPSPSDGGTTAAGVTPLTAAEAEADRRRRSGSPLERSLQALVDEAAGNADRVRANIEHWYDAQMERVSGWYKRESKRILLVLAAVVVVLMNVDTLAIARTLWTSPTARRTVADAAQQQIEAAVTTTTVAFGEPPAPLTPSAEAKPAPVLSCPKPAAADDAEATPTTTTPGPAEPGEVVAGALDCAQSLPIPIGWRLPPDCRRPGADDKCGPSDKMSDAWFSLKEAFPLGWLMKLLGWGITVGALTFGAPFWFDLLNRFGSLRASGVKPKPSAESPS